jgi:alpha-ketoglutarate-dependent 2,4-dichlorophenoxyacetate dioxygenase
LRHCHLAGDAWLARLVGLPPVRPIARVAYDRFADLLYAWNRRKGHWCTASRWFGAARRPHGRFDRFGWRNPISSLLANEGVARLAVRCFFAQDFARPRGEMRMDIVPLGPGFAAELRGVTLADVATDDAAYRAVRAAFEAHSVLVLRGQDVTDESQIAFSHRFGPLEITPAATQGAGTHLVILSTIGPDGKVVAADSRVALRNKANQLWHADSTFKSVPALASVLSARIIPSHGGETEFVSTRLAFDRLDRATQQRVADLFAWHDYSHSRGKIAPGIVGADERAALPPQCWRMVWTNPANGARSLYIASHAYAIEGMEHGAAQNLIAALTEAATSPGLSFTHRWRQGDVVMWDNRATLHRGRPWPPNEARLIVRTTVSASDADGLQSVRQPARQAAE